MNLDSIKTLCEKGEEKVVEFKSSTSHLRATFETICAFLNGDGGTVLMGVRDDGRILGQDISDNTRKEIAREIKRIEPAPLIEIEYIDLENNKAVIAIHVDAGNHAPYTYDGRPWQRDESETNRMSQHRYEQLLVKRGQLNYSWEVAIAENYTIDDLDHEEIRLAVQQGIAAGRVSATAEGESIAGILKSWNLFNGDRLNNAAVVLFAKNTLPLYTQCHIKLGRFRGTDMLGDFIDNKEFFGNAFRLFEAANSFIMRHLPIASFFETDRVERIDKPALPALAVREALVNAICHRDYSNRLSSITLAIFDDRMEIWNNGKLPTDLKVENLKKKHKSEPPNKNMAKVFYDRKYFDGWGTGIIKIFDLCRENDIPAPKYEEYSGGIEITFRFKDSIAVTRIEKKVEQLSTRQEEILAVIKQHGAITLKKLSDELENPPSERMIRKELNALKKQGVIGLQGSARSTVWTLKK
jgi:ATP-dependent DNA helicase RecG